MKTPPRILIRLLVFFCSLPLSILCFSQGRVVINEYMPWTSNTCGGPTAEFIELLNFGPGPINIGCYILTDGDFSITIPPNTFLQPGEFYVISGQDIINYPCANIDSTIHVQLNWNTCNCTSGQIPTTGEGFLTDGGSGNEQVVLMDPNLKIIDAVARSLPVETASLITTSSIGGCTPRTFDLDTMVINYETIGESAGRGNSFARKLDGDCGWVKDPQQSAHATNNTPGDESDIRYTFSYINSQYCHGPGEVAVSVNAESFSDIFPMNYTLAFDADNDGIFEITDTYTYGIDSTPPSIVITGLGIGNYRLTVASVKGCFLKTFPFIILDCLPILDVKLIDFKSYVQGNQLTSSWQLENAGECSEIIIEGSTDGTIFKKITLAYPPFGITALWNGENKITLIDGKIQFIRLQIITRTNNSLFSEVIRIIKNPQIQIRTWPNPVIYQIHTEAIFAEATMLQYRVLEVSGKVISTGEIKVKQGLNRFTIPTVYSTGYYLLSFIDKTTGKPLFSQKILKQ